MSAANRARIFLSRYGDYVSVLLVVLGLLAVANAGWIVTHPQTETVSEETNVQSISADVGTSSLVSGDSSLYERGETLVDMPVYFLASNPHLTITVTSATPQGVETAVTTRVLIEQRATREGEEYFSTNRTVIDRTDRTAGGQVVAEAEVNMTALRAEVSRNRGETQGIGSYQTSLAVRVEYETDAYSGTLGGSTPIEFTSGAYWLGGDVSEDRRHATTTTRQVTRPRDWSGALGYGVVGLILLGGAWAIRYRLSEVDLESISVAYDHDQFAEWISHGEFPTGTGKRYISITDLADLVDIAIDSNKRVIYDESLEVYCVIDGDLVYYFSREPFNIDVWLDT